MSEVLDSPNSVQFYTQAKTNSIATSGGTAPNGWGNNTAAQPGVGLCNNLIKMLDVLMKHYKEELQDVLI